MHRALVLSNAKSSNVGNGALLHGSLHSLSEDTGREWAFDVVPWDEYSFGQRSFNRTFVDTVNDHDALLVIGAVTFNGRVHYAAGGSRFNLGPDLLREIRSPIAFLGLSYRFWPGETYHHLKALDESIRYIESREDFLFGLRNDGTRAWLQSLIGREITGAVDVPDPAMFVPFVCAETKPDRPRIIFSLNNEDSVRRFRGTEAINAFLDVLARAMVFCVEELQCDVVLACHYFDDIEWVNPILKRLPPPIAHMHVEVLGPVHIRNTESFYSEMAKAAVIVAMRVHSMTPAFGLGVPLVVIHSQDRIVHFVKNAGFEAWSVSHRDPRLESVLVQAIQTVLKDPVANLRQAAKIFSERRAQLKSFNTKLVEIIEKYGS